MKPPKYPDEFKDWKPLYRMNNDQFLILESPDETQQACIHLVDNEVVGIMDKASEKLVYDGNMVFLKKILKQLNSR